MKWPNVKLIFAREMRDQMRDRRTLFTVAIMPLLLYPLMGMAMLQVAQFMRQHPTKIWLVGNENLPADAQLVGEDRQFRESLIPQKDRGLIEVASQSEHDSEFKDIIRRFREGSQIPGASKLVDKLLQTEMKEHGYDLAVFIPGTVEPKETEDIKELGEILIFQNSTSDKSRMAAERFSRVLGNWKATFVKQSLADVGVPISLALGVRITNQDIADNSGKQAAIWSKILPFIVMIWCLTGAFYPAIDLCAGEKERGTFETLLSSPAERTEIAIGKLLTVMSFSMATSLLNLLSMGITGIFLAGKVGGGMTAGLPIGPPSLSSIGWLLLALIPISALFSAIALAAAAFARSSKEGQYYLVPLMMISMPLMMIPMLPGAQLDLGTSLIPVSGLMLLLKGLIEGEFAQTIQFAGPVCAITLVCCWLSIRWVVHQFNSESVLFRASERFAISTWFKHVIRERTEMPSFGNAILCGIIILVAKFFLGMVVQPPVSFAGFAKVTLIILLASIAAPAVMMAVMLARKPLSALRLKLCSLPMACFAIGAAILLNPLFTWFSAFVLYIYPPAGDLVQLENAVSMIMGNAPGLWAVILVIALAPAVIEELAYRGFILSGLETKVNKWQAIIISSVLFGVAHGVIQQSIITFGVGMVIGFIAVQSRSIFPCILFHFTHNSLAVLLSNAKAEVIHNSPILSNLLYTSNGETFQYGIVPGIVMTLCGVGLLIWFSRLKPVEADENHQQSTSVPFFARLLRPRNT